MKKLLYGITLLMLTCCLTVTAFASTTDALVQQTVQQLEIMNGDQNGNMNLEDSVTRAEFTKMLVAASSMKDEANNAGYTLYVDVASTHWASGYINVATQQGWMNGYLDGSFRTENTVLLEEAVTAMLRVLGYSNLSGTYPAPQMVLYTQLGLDDDITAVQGEPLTRYDCMYLFYNMMGANTSTGTPYANTLGYSLNSEGNIDTLLLSAQFTKGPYTVSASGFASTSLPLTGNYTIYKNDRAATASDINPYDIYYYNQELNILWVYNDRITGRVTYIDSVQSPSAVTVAGMTYGLETATLAAKFSTGGTVALGDFVTLLLGNTGQVADVALVDDLNGEIVGIVVSNQASTYVDENGVTQTDTTIRVVSANGDVLQYNTGSVSYNEGRMVSITISNGDTTIVGLTDSTLSGTVNSTGTALGTTAFADDIDILEVSGTSYQTIYADRLAGYTLEKGDIRYYTKNTKGEIDSMILEDTTGDLEVYALMTSADEVGDYGFYVGVYVYMINGIPGYEQTASLYDVDWGGVQFTYENGAITDMTQLSSRNVATINSLTAIISGTRHTLSENLQVYQYIDGSYYAVTLSDVSDLTTYQLTGYYDDNDYSAGNQIRILVAKKK